MSQLSAVVNGYDQVAPFDQGELINLVADYTQVDPATVDYNRARDYVLEFEPNVDAIEYSPLRTALEGAGVDFTSTYILNDDVYGIANELVERGLLTQEDIDWTTLPEGGQDPERLAYVASLLPLRLNIPEFRQAYEQALQEGTDNAVTRIDSFFRQVHNGLGPENFIGWTPTPVTIPVTVQDSSDIPSDLALAVNALASDVDNITLDSVVGTEQTPALTTPAVQQVIGSPARSVAPTGLSPVRSQSPVRSSPRQAAMLGSLGQVIGSPVRSVAPTGLSPVRSVSPARLSPQAQLIGSPSRLSPARLSPIINQPELTTIPAAGLSNVIVENEVPRTPSPVRLSPQNQAINLPNIPSPGVSNVAITLPQIQSQSSAIIPNVVSQGNLGQFTPTIQRQPMSQFQNQTNVLPTIPSPGVSNVALNVQQQQQQQFPVVGQIGQQPLIPQVQSQVNVTPTALQTFNPIVQRQPMSQFQQQQQQQFPVVVPGGQQFPVVGSQFQRQPSPATRELPSVVDPIGQRSIVTTEGRQSPPTGLGAQQTQVPLPSGPELQAQQVNATMLAQGLRAPLSSVIGQTQVINPQIAQRPLIPQTQVQQSPVIGQQFQQQQPPVVGSQVQQFPAVGQISQQANVLPTIPSPGVSNVALNVQQPSGLNVPQQQQQQQFSLYGAQQQSSTVGLGGQQPQRTIISTRTGGAVPPPAQVVQNVQAPSFQQSSTVGLIGQQPSQIANAQQPQGIASQYAVTTAPGTVSRSTVEWIPGPYTPQMFMEGMNIQDIRDYIRSLNPKSRVGRTLEEAATIMANFLNVRPETATTHPFTFTRGRGTTSSSRSRQQSQYVIPQAQGIAGTIQGNIPQPVDVRGNVIGQNALSQPFSSTSTATRGYQNVQPLPTRVTTTPQRNQLPVAYTTAQRNESEDVKDLRIALLQAGQQRLRQLYRQVTGANVRVGVNNASIVDELISLYNTGRVTAQQLLQGATAAVTPTRRSNRLGTGQLAAQQGINPDVLPYFNALQTTPVDQIIQLMRINVPAYITDEQSRLAYVRNNINDYANVVRSSGSAQPVSKQQLMAIPNVEQFLDMFTDIDLIGMAQAVVPYESRRELVTGTAALTREPGAFIPTARDCRNAGSSNVDLNNPSSVNVIAVGLLDSYDCYTVEELARGVTTDQLGSIIIMLDNGTLITQPKIMTDIYNLSRIYPQLRSIAQAVEAQQRALQGQPQSSQPQAGGQQQANILRQL